MAYLLLLLTFLLALAPRQLDLRLAAGEWNGVLAELRADLAAAVAAKESESEGLARVQIAQALVERSSYHELDEKSAADASLEALSICENRAPAALGRALLVRGRFLYSRAFDNGDWAAPKTLIRQALVRFEERRDVRGQSESWFYLGLIEQMQERLDKADEFFRKGLGQAQGLDAPLLESYFHRHLGYSAQSRKQYDSAEKALRESLRLREKAGATVFTPFARIALAGFFAETGRAPDEIRGLYVEAALAAEKSGSLRAAFQAYLALARLPGAARLRRDLATKALDAARGYGDPGAVKEAEEFLASLPRS
jgi:tetratricopeptide (TPR) repeat protein